MAKLRSKTAFLSWTLLIVVTLIGATFGCSSHSEERKPRHRYRYHFNDPRYHDSIPANRKHVTTSPADKLLVPEYELAVPQTSCGRTLCANILNYPLEEINGALDRVRNILRPGDTIIALQRKGLSYGNFTSKYDSFWYGERAPDHEFLDETTDCKERINTIYPQEGQSSEDGRVYYVVNVPTAYRGLTQMVCESGNSQMCIKGNDLLDASRTCRQMYREEKLVVLPIGKRHFDVEDFELKPVYVPTGCACIPTP
ncbi:uncharacterized protein LOC131666589 [Phymastichus coffea]|uniref:uncharacterized protein LOC131666589 n=1 Tax=Phymastichus coffea TaxID=108790 RepID=UPI00273ADBCD|nr:uncharacterized protein LOC131666589 [Phymastichus coffea]